MNLTRGDRCDDVHLTVLVLSRIRVPRTLGKSSTKAKGRVAGDVVAHDPLHPRVGPDPALLMSRTVAGMLERLFSRVYPGDAPATVQVSDLGRPASALAPPRRAGRGRRAGPSPGRTGRRSCPPPVRRRARKRAAHRRQAGWPTWRPG